MNKLPHAVPALVVALALTPPLVRAAVIEVDTAADEINANGQCSLREAVINANNGDQSGSTDCPAGTPPMVGDADTITFSPSLDGTPIVLTLTGAGENAALTGDLDVTDNLGIFGNGRDATVIDGGGADRILDAQPTTPPLNQLSLLVESLTLRNGAGVQRGGAVYMRDLSSVLVVEDAEITGNETAGVGLTAGGGGIYAEGSLLLEDTVVHNNQTIAGPGLSALGGGVFAGHSFAAGDTVIEGNLVQSDSGTAQGGGLVVVGGGSPLFVENSAVRANTAVALDGGAVAGGGGVIQDVSAMLGEAIVRNTEISDNQADTNGSLASGGGLYVAASALLVALENVTVSGNVAGDPVLTASATGGGIHDADGNAIFLNSTITDNAVQAASSAVGGGIHAGAANTGLVNSILAGNHAPDGTGPDCEGMLVSGGYSLLGSNAGCDWDAAIGDLIGDVDGGLPPIDPLLEPLADNGGPTRTHGLDPASPALDSANPDMSGPFTEVCTDIDQRGYIRPVDGNDDGMARCDRGALEHDSFLEVFFVDGFESD